MIDTQRLGALLRALVRDDAQTARLRTPAAIAVRPTDGVDPELDSPGAQVAHVAAPVAQQAARVPPSSAALELSDAGRMLLSALRVSGAPIDGVTVPRGAMQPVLVARDDDAADARGSAATRARPLVAVPPHSEYATDRLALQLKDAVEFSGVFYESHLAQWADDLRPRALLAHEPQARWPVAAEIAHTATAAAQAPGDYAAPMLRQQLEVLDTGRFVWAGELWPGQRGALVIEEDEPSAHPDASAGMPRVARWRVLLTLDFAHLGTIDASLLLAGDSLDLALRCDAADVATQMRAAAPTLRAAIAERALDLDHISIADDRAA